MSQTTSGSSQEDTPIKYVCGIDVGSQSCAGCVCRPDKSVVVKPVTFANAKDGWEALFEKLSRLDALPKQILIGMEATSRYGENLYQEAQARGYQLCLLHPGQTHQFHRQQGVRAKTDRLDAMTIAKVLLSGEARAGYVPSEQITTYRELVRLHTRLSDEAASYQNEIQALVVVLFPEFTRVCANPCLPSALAVRNRLPQCPRRCGSRGGADDPAVANPDLRARMARPTARKLVDLAHNSVSSNRALSGRSTSLRILCDQLEHTQANLARLQAELEQLLAHDPGVKGLEQIPEFGPKTVAVLRAELGDVHRFSRTDQVIAYGGMDIEIKESGQWKGKAKLSKHGSGLVRRVLYLAALRSIHLQGSAFGAYYRRLVQRGLRKGSALMAVMRKMLAVAAHLLKHEEESYDPSKVCVGDAT